MRHFAHHIGDYAAATAHLPFVEDAAYHRLLRRYYQDEKPLPADLAAVQRLVGARTKDERSAVEAVLREFFTLEDDGWHQARANREIEVYRVKVAAARENGTKGGRPANRAKTEPVIFPVQSEKLSTPHSPLPTLDSEAKASGADAPDAKKLAFDAGVKILTGTGLKEPQARSLIGKWRKDNGDDAVLTALGSYQRSGASEPISWITASFSADKAESRDARKDREIQEAIQRSKLQ